MIIFGDEEPQKIDIFRRVDAKDPPARWPTAEDIVRAEHRTTMRKGGIEADDL